MCVCVCSPNNDAQMFEENFAHDNLPKAHRWSLPCSKNAHIASDALVLFFTAEDSLVTENDCCPNIL